MDLVPMRLGDSRRRVDSIRLVRSNRLGREVWVGVCGNAMIGNGSVKEVSFVEAVELDRQYIVLRDVRGDLLGSVVAADELQSTR